MGIAFQYALFKPTVGTIDKGINVASNPFDCGFQGFSIRYVSVTQSSSPPHQMRRIVLRH